MKKRNKILLFFSIYTFIIFAIHIFRPGTSQQYSLIGSWINYITGIIGILFGVWATKYFGLKNNKGKSTLFLTLTIFLWTFGDFLWIFYEEAVVSLADFFYLLGYPVLAISLYFALKSFSGDFLLNKKMVARTFFVSLIITILFFSLLPLQWDSSLSIIENLLTSGYVFVDFIIIISVGVLMSNMNADDFLLPWLLISLGIIMWWLGDIYYALNFESYATGDFIDMAWYLGYILPAAGMYLLMDIDRNQKEKEL